MKATSQTFDSSIDAWNNYQDAPWGKLRYRVAEANLNRHLPPLPAQILDVGSGNGLDAISLAKQGYGVTVVDFSAEMLGQGRQLAAREDVSDFITFQQADALMASQFIPTKAFDVILCHNLLQYLDEPLALLTDVHQALQSDGVLSLIITNPYAETYAMALRQLNLKQALADLGKTTHFVEGFGVNIQRYTDDELLQMLETAGFTMVQRYGIRCVNDYIADNDLKTDPDFYQQLEALELALSDKYPFYLLARFYHLIARKTAASIRDNS